MTVKEDLEQSFCVFEEVRASAVLFLRMPAVRADDVLCCPGGRASTTRRAVCCRGAILPLTHRENAVADTTRTRIVRSHPPISIQARYLLQARDEPACKQERVARPAGRDEVVVLNHVRVAVVPRGTTVANTRTGHRDTTRHASPAPKSRTPHHLPYRVKVMGPRKKDPRRPSASTTSSCTVRL